MNGKVAACDRERDRESQRITMMCCHCVSARQRAAMADGADHG
jgi:hypothetical protein